MRNILTLALVASCASLSWARNADQAHELIAPRVANQAANPVITGMESDGLQAGRLAEPVQVINDTQIGDAVQLGTTTYEYQSNGSTRMIAVSSDGVAHGSVMHSAQLDGWSDRKVKAWCVNPDLSVVDPLDAMAERTGYTTMAVTSAAPANGLSANSSVIALHSNTDSWFGVDFFGCTHAFQLTQTNTGMLWPHVALDGDDRIHVVNYDSASNDVWYQASSDGFVWDASPVMLTDNSQALGAMAVGSKTSSRAAVLFHETTSTEDIPYDMGDGYIGIQIHSDILGVIADDGDITTQVNEGHITNFTNYGPNSEAPFGDYGSRAYADVDGIFDHTEANNLHVTFTGGPQYTDTIHAIWDPAIEDTMMYEYMHWNLGKGHLWHHNVDTGSWSLIWGSNTIFDDREVESGEDWVRSGAWRQANDRPNFAIDPETGYLYCAWNQRLAADQGPPDADGLTIGNGEIYISCSADNGETWGQPVNVSETPSPDCATGECASEDWVSMAEIVDDYIHLTYIYDLDPGGYVQEQGGSYACPYYYHRIPKEAVPPHDGTPWNANGKVGLAQTVRWVGWYASAWCGDSTSAAAFDSVQWIDPVHLLNESDFDVPLSHISWHHSMLDQIGPAEDGGLTDIHMTVKTDNGYIPVDQWDGVLPAMRGTKFNVYFSYAGFTNYDVLIGFHFDDDRPSCYYRMEMVNALDVGETEYCTGVNLIPVADVDQFEETVLRDFSDDLGEQALPGDFALSQNVPNPFNPTTQISYTLQRGLKVKLSVYNLNGQLVDVLEDGFRGTGSHTVSFDASNLSSGVYFYTLEAGSHVETKKMILVR